MPTTITNRYGLPQPIVDAVKYGAPRIHGDISVSALIDTPRIRMLKRKHTLEEDVMDRVWALFGSSVHSIIEKANLTNPDRYLMEQAVAHKISGWDVYGIYDIYDKQDAFLYDVKVTSVWSHVFGADKWQWDAQTNILAFLLEKNDCEVKGINIIQIFRDWKESESLKNADYPRHQITPLPIKKYSTQQMQNYLEDRVSLHQRAEKGDIIDCTPKDMWQKETKYAVRTADKERAIRLFNDKIDADDYITKHPDVAGLFVETRPGSCPRCERYCPVRDYCEQRQRMNQ